MLRFFRKMRKALIPESRFGRYFFYAVGEIVLVVIGILIALQINNWNEKRKIKNQELIFFIDILNDLDKDDAKLTYLNHFHTKRIEYIDTLMYYVRQPGKHMGSKKFGMYIEPLYYIEDATNYSTTFESAKASASFGGFQQKELIKDLTEYYADFVRLQSNFASIRTIVERQMEPILSSLKLDYVDSNTGNLVISENDVSDFYKKVGAIKDNRTDKKDKTDYRVILRDPKFESYLIGDLGRTIGALGIIRSRQSQIKEVEMNIKNYLNINK